MRHQRNTKKTRNRIINRLKPTLKSIVALVIVDKHIGPQDRTNARLASYGKFAVS